LSEEHDLVLYVLFPYPKSPNAQFRRQEVEATLAQAKAKYLVSLQFRKTLLRSHEEATPGDAFHKNRA